MAYIQRITPPPNKLLNFTLKDFSGGLNNRSDQLKDNEAPDILNMDFADDTIMEKRKGQEYFNEWQRDNTNFIGEFRPHQDEDVLVTATNTHLYIENEVLTDLNGSVNPINHNGRLMFADGDKLYVYAKFPQEESTYFKIHGNTINDYVLFEVVSPKDNHPRLDTSHVQGVLNVDYNNYTVYYEPCENEMLDNFMGANVVPKGAKYLVSHVGRLFVSGMEDDDDAVFISHISNPFYFPVTLPMRLPPNSDKIVGMHIFDDTVVVGRKDDLYAIFGRTNRPDTGFEPFSLRRINTHTGFANHKAIDIAHNYLFYLGNDGNVYALSSTRLDEKLISTTIISRQLDLFKHPINITRDDFKTANSVFFNDRWYLNIGDVTLVYFYRTRSWTLFKNINATHMYVYKGKLIWSNKDGYIAQFSDNNYLDFGKPYKCYWHSKLMDMGDANSFKQFRECFLVAHTYEEHNSLINVRFEIDYTDVKDRVVIENQISIWGKSKWGDRLINRNINETYPIIIGRRGRNIRFKITNGYEIHGEVNTFDELETYRGRVEGVLVYVLDEEAYYLYTSREWVKQDIENDLNQRLKFYQVNGDYELRGKR